MRMNGEISDIDKTYKHWLETSNKDFDTMLNLFQSKDYHWSLFMGHLVIEKLLKAAIVKQSLQHAPFSHDLRRLANKSNIKFEEKHYAWLDTITTFNLNARYDTYKQAFYKKCTYGFTTDWIYNIKAIRSWIKQKL